MCTHVGGQKTPQNSLSASTTQVSDTKSRSSGLERFPLSILVSPLLLYFSKQEADLHLFIAFNHYTIARVLKPEGIFGL